MHAPELGTEFAGFRIDSLVGRGGMGVVYRAWQLELERTVALKVIAPEALEDDAARARFVSEARHAAAIEHPNVVPIYAAGEAGGMAYFVMRFVEGDDLRTRVRRGGPLSPTAAATVLGSAADALDAIHHAGLVHRDVKPANILLGAGDHVYLTDFGLAREALARGSSATGSDRWAGSLHYAAPEQIRGGRVDARADVYALGGVLVFMLTGRVPFDRDSDEATLWAHVADPPPRPAELRHGLPKTFDDLVARAMAKHPDDRYASAGDLGRAALAAAQGRRPPRRRAPVAQGAASPAGAVALPGLIDEAPTLTGTAAGPAGEAPARRRRTLGGAIAVAAALLVGVAALIARGRDDHPANTPAATAVVRRSATATPTHTHTATPAGPRVARTFRSVSHRPNAVIRVGRDLWVTSASRPLIRLDAMTGRGRTLDTRLGPGGAALSRRGSVVWIENRTQRKVVAVAASPPHRLVLSVRQTEVPVDVAAEPSGGMWLTVRGHNHGPGAVLHYDAGGRLLQRFDVPAAVRSLVLAPTAVWATEVETAALLRIDRRTGAQAVTPLTTAANWLAYGGGCVWASISSSNAIARVCPHHAADYHTAGQHPERLTYARGRLYVASRFDDTLLVINPRTMRTEKRLPMPLNPFAVTSDRRHVWVTSLGADTVTRVDLP